MGFDRAVRLLGYQVPDLNQIYVRSSHANDASLKQNGPFTKVKALFPRLPGFLAPQRPRKSRKDFSRSVSNCGADDDFLPQDVFDHTSDTESESEDEERMQRYLNQMQEDDRPIETVYGPGVIVYDSFGGTRHLQLPQDVDDVETFDEQPVFSESLPEGESFS